LFRNRRLRFDLNWRMAYVGTVSFVDAYGEALEVRALRLAGLR